jgi:hypothetical protein
LSRGSSPAGYPAEPLVSYQINRQLSGWIPPPLVIRAFGAHCHEQTSPNPLVNPTNDTTVAATNGQSPPRGGSKVRSVIYRHWCSIPVSLLRKWQTARILFSERSLRA